MKPTSPRAARRLAKKASKDTSLTLPALMKRVEMARVKSLGPAHETRAKRILGSYLQTALSYGMPVKEVIDEMASGQAAWRLGHAVRDEMLKTPPDAVRKAACQQGCAFCCILSGGDGGLITGYEAGQLHQALSPLQNTPDGRNWHKAACPALDPDSRTCRAYEARPMICRSFLSLDAEACQQNAEGGEVQGPGLLGSHLDYLAVHALCRQALKGIAQVHSYSMAAVAAATVDGVSNALNAAKHGPSALERACKDGARAAGA